MGIGRLALRVTVGGFFIGHGTQKLLGWFGGHGIDATAQGFASLGLHPGRRNAVAAGVSETAGGTLLALGLATPLSAAILTGTMLTAIHRVHLSKGPWLANGGYEYNAVLIAAVLAIAETGPGDISLDAALGNERHGPLAAALALAAGASGALMVDAAARRAAAALAPADGDAPAEPAPSEA